MSDQALTEQQHREVKQVAKLEVRQYFDHYLRDVWPQQAAALERQCEHNVQHHNEDPEAHGGVPRKFTRLVWIGLGVALAGGGSGFGLARLLSSLAG